MSECTKCFFFIAVGMVVVHRRRLAADLAAGQMDCNQAVVVPQVAAAGVGRLDTGDVDLVVGIPDRVAVDRLVVGVVDDIDYNLVVVLMD